MDNKLTPLNKTAQLNYLATGNPASTQPASAISNCFPGLEYDFKNFWRRIFVGIVLLEWDNYVIEIEDPKLQDLLHHRLLKVDGMPIITTVSGPVMPGGDPQDLPLGKAGVVTMEWSNALAFISRNAGKSVTCHFTRAVSHKSHPMPKDPAQMIEVELTVHQIFDGESAAPSADFLKPGELTQGLCSPWQHDYRECACYYWPASRPDYVNVEPTPEGISTGDNWLAKKPRPGEYILDDRKDSRLVTYDDLFKQWEKELHFQIRGRDIQD